MKRLLVVIVLALAACGGGASKSNIDAFMAARLKGSEAQMAPACALAVTNLGAAEAMFQNTNSHYSGEDLAKAFVRWCAAHPAVNP